MAFSAQWLALREPADLAARDPGLLAAAARIAGPDPVILDLGCGTGSTLRAISPCLPDHARWHLVDIDPALLALAADAAPGRSTTYQLDLRDLDSLPLKEVTLVTASALLDLLPASWITAFAARLARAGLPFYAALSYDGDMSWQPDLPDDAAVTRAFNAHQRRDKGLGPALGPDAALTATRVLEQAGLAVRTAPSPWRIRADQNMLHAELVAGIARAAAEQDRRSDEIEGTCGHGAHWISAWARDRARLPETGLCTIGHQDLLAVPRQDGRSAP
ncbi:MAG: class I SAM-dependent methyltransferase [Paracoccus sp. (in: a-proteobacteria)]|nr:class I SAM-dependent methyltransferase [Paracoccus sp. (in: a-proteobacteria)]